MKCENCSLPYLDGGGVCDKCQPDESPADQVLLPCPFCGGPAEIWNAHQNPKRTAWIACMGRCCVLVSKEHETTEEAIQAWNTRAS